MLRIPKRLRKPTFALHHHLVLEGQLHGKLAGNAREPRFRTGYHLCNRSGSNEDLLEARSRLANEKRPENIRQEPETRQTCSRYTSI